MKSHFLLKIIEKNTFSVNTFCIRRQSLPQLCDRSSSFAFGLASFGFWDVCKPIHSTSIVLAHISPDCYQKSIIPSFYVTPKIELVNSKRISVKEFNLKVITRQTYLLSIFFIYQSKPSFIRKKYKILNSINR